MIDSLIVRSIIPTIANIIETTIFNIPIRLLFSINCFTPFAIIDIAEQKTANGKKNIFLGFIKDNVNSTIALIEKAIIMVNKVLDFFIKFPPKLR